MDLTKIGAPFRGGGTPLIRTDFTSDPAWTVVVEQVTKPVDLEDPENSDPVDGYVPYIVVVDDAAFAGMSGTALAEAIAAADAEGGYVVLADARSMAEAAGGGELTVNYVDLSVPDPEDAELFGAFRGRAFRCTVAEFARVEANFSISNLDFEDFADSVDPDGVFRGFTR
ncbi:DUF6924 domain-containing protein [Nocardioides conyzicola]|uniref:DUF6924 domain-containing protein n=1 Tax=Nocardioides conyzicola TaxID=1651781 RepID=A0ABP8XWB5_9ACTN